MPSLLLLLIVYHEEEKHAIHLAALEAGEFWRKIVKFPDFLINDDEGTDFLSPTHIHIMP